jgi:hypothetical protein
VEDAATVDDAGTAIREQFRGYCPGVLHDVTFEGGRTDCLDFKGRTICRR